MEGSSVATLWARGDDRLPGMVSRAEVGRSREAEGSVGFAGFETSIGDVELTQRLGRLSAGCLLTSRYSRRSASRRVRARFAGGQTAAAPRTAADRARWADSN